MSADYGVALSLARYRAKQIVKERWVAKGHRITELRLRDVVERDEALLRSNPEMLAELLDEARETIARSPDTNPHND
jgi:hypothetical protein